jgi:GNAT superfamily N-acetyltransferase
MTARDHPVVLRLWLDLVEHHRTLDPDYPPVPNLTNTLARELERAARLDSCRVWVADCEGQVRGFAIAEIEEAPLRDPPERGGCWIHEVYIEPAFRQRGYASALVAKAEAFFAEHGGLRTAVRVESHNRASYRFWQRRGFVERARILEKAT